MQRIQERMYVAAGSAAYPESSSAMLPSSQNQLDQALARLQASRAVWPDVNIIERIHLLEELRHNLKASAPLWVEAALSHKGMGRGSMAEAEEWIYVGIMLRVVLQLQRVLGQLRTWSVPRLPKALSVRPNGQLKVENFPDTFLDRITFPGMRGEVWLEPGVAPEEVFDIPSMGVAASSVTGGPITGGPSYGDINGKPAATAPGKIALVLGAGNLSPLAFLDVLSKLFVQNQVVILKLNPANDYLGPLYEDTLAPLIRAGFVQMAYGGSEVGAYLSNHPLVDTIHLTGSDKTYEAIVFGSGEEGMRRKEAGTPLLDKPFTSELGGVNPIIVVPGPWSARQVRQKADLLASHFYINASFNCLTPRVIIQHAEWPQREALIRTAGEILSRAGSRPAYYPGAIERYQSLLDSRPWSGWEKKLVFGEEGDGILPFTLLYDVDPDDASDPIFRTESFCSLYAETALAARSVPEFIHQAVDFANQRLWGNLSATILVHPESLKDPQTAAAVDRAIEKLEFGLLTVNTTANVAFGSMMPVFGAFPGNTPANIQSGMGKMNNFYFLNRPQKAVLYAPFNSIEIYSLSANRSIRFGQRSMEFYGDPVLWNYVKLVGSLVS